MNFPVHFSSQLREHLLALRKARGLTQAALGQLVGVGQARIAEIEGNPSVVSVDQLMKLLSALHVSLVLRVDDADSAADRASPCAMSPASALANTTPKSLGRLGVKPPADGQGRVQPLAKGEAHSPKSARASLGDAKTASEARALRDADVDKGPTLTSRRNAITRSKRGSW